MFTATLTVLVIEDDDDDYLLIQSLFSEIPYPRHLLKRAASYDHAMKELESSYFDVCLLDYRLGKRDGLEILKEARAREWSIPIILLTGQGDHLLDIGAMEAGAADFLVKKQISAPLLERSIRYAIKARREEESLRRAEAKYRTLVEQIPAITYMTTHRDRNKILYISPQIETLLGYPKGAGESFPDIWGERLHPEDRGRIMAELTDSRSPERPFRAEYRMISKDDKLLWFLDEARIVRDKSGNSLFFQGVMFDVTEEKKLRQEAEYRLQQVIHADRMASLGEVVAGVAHEINNPNSFISCSIPPLQKIWGFFEPILIEYSAVHPEWKRGKLTLNSLRQDMKEIVEAIKIGSDRINSVVNILKELAVPDGTTSPRLVQVNEIINKTMIIVGSKLRKAASRVELSLADDLPDIPGYFHRLEQVVANLLLNAAYAITDKATGRICITTRFVERLGAVLIEIEDNGTGIEQEVMGRLFDPFFTTRRASGGTGLGLSVSYGLVREHKGILGVLSRPGRGSRFTVFLPVGKSIEIDLQPEILVIDDDIELVNMIRLQLRTGTQNVSYLSDVRSAMVYIESHPEVDIVLCNLMTPGMSRWTGLSRIKKRFPLLPVILYSENTNVLEERPTGAPEACYLLEKPFSMRDLGEIIDKIGRQKL